MTPIYGSNEPSVTPNAYYKLLNRLKAFIPRSKAMPQFVNQEEHHVPLWRGPGYIRGFNLDGQSYRLLLKHQLNPHANALLLRALSPFS